jgi:hypothetical protein
LLQGARALLLRDAVTGKVKYWEQDVRLLTSYETRASRIASCRRLYQRL